MLTSPLSCFLLIAYISFYGSQAISSKRFPVDFKLGAATASYQIEGAWDADGKGVNIWDHFTHTYPDRIKESHNGDIACDSYNKYKEDVAMLADLGAKIYRFSLSWSRILPTGFTNRINQAGVDYYRNLIDELVANGIEPMISIYHWDLPQPLQDLGGWHNPIIAEHFGNFARLAFQYYGDSVKYWMTFNEPSTFCHMGYGEAQQAPGIYSPGVGVYLCSYTVLKAHALAYHIYDEEFRPTQQGKVTINTLGQWYEPANYRLLDIVGAIRARDFTFGWFAQPVFHGNYPKVMIDRIGSRSAAEGFAKSRLPEFTPEEIEYIKGTADYVALNFYSTYYATMRQMDSIGTPSIATDIGVTFGIDPTWTQTGSDWLFLCPWGLRNMLRYIKNNFNDPEILITENGVSDFGGMDDNIRTEFLQNFLSEILDAIVIDNVNVTGYTYWSLMDNFEWFEGYTEKFGLFSVDFDDPERPRTPKESVNYYRKVISTRCLVDECED